MPILFLWMKARVLTSLAGVEAVLLLSTKKIIFFTLLYSFWTLLGLVRKSYSQLVNNLTSLANYYCTVVGLSDWQDSWLSVHEHNSIGQYIQPITGWFSGHIVLHSWQACLPCYIFSVLPFCASALFCQLWYQCILLDTSLYSPKLASFLLIIYF